MQMLLTRRPEKNWIGRYPRTSRNQNGEHLGNLCESNILETQVIFTTVNKPERYFLLRVQII